MTEVWLVIHKDRHFGVDVAVFSNWDAASKEVDKVLDEYVRHPESVEVGEDEVERDITYSCEGDYIRIERAEVKS